MTFAQYFKASSYCLIGSGFAAIAATGGIDRISIVLFAAVFVTSWFLDTARLRQAVPAWVLNLMGIAYLPFYIIDTRLLSHSLITATFHLLFFTAAVKLLTLSKDRDYVLLYLISFAELLGASILTVNIVFAACFLLFLFSGISTLVLFEMRRTNARMQNEARIQPLVVPRQLRGTGLELFSPFPTGLLSAMVVGITLLIIAVASPIFFLLPRVNLGLYKPPSGDAQLITGFSERVELGQIGNIKQSDTVVMRVKTDKSPSELPSDLKWRGLAFDYYDGRAWERSDRVRRRTPIETTVRYHKLESSMQGTDLVDQTFFVEALSTNVIFATHKALAVSRDVGPLRRDGSENLYTVRRSYKKLRYSALSDPIRPDLANISDRLPIPPDILKTYTQVPSGDARVAELAKQVTRSEEDKYSKARALEQYLRTHYSYSLVLHGKRGGRDPLAMFLFDVRSGHCEYFASAMTIMLRQIGIPARLVNGFRIGEYNSLGKSWTVRQYDAHSWVEACFPPYGWVEFDPTPPDPERPRSALIRMISNLGDAVDLWWWEGVVNYDSSKQYRVISALRVKIQSLQQSMRGLAALVREKLRAGAASIRSPNLTLASSFAKRWTLWLPCLAAGILLMIRPVRRRILDSARRALLYRRDPKSVATGFYREALILLGDHGMKRGHGQTPMEFARGLGNHPAGSPLLSLTSMYNAVRFGTPGAPVNRSEAQALLNALRTALKTRP